jgi:hypothetical protein
VLATKKKTTKTHKMKTVVSVKAEKKSVKSQSVVLPAKTAAKLVTIDRRRNEDRRAKSKPAAAEREPLERRAKVNRRRQIDPTTCERDYTLEEIEFMRALDDYKRANGRMFPTCSEVLEVIHKLGYEKRPVADPIPVTVEEVLSAQSPTPAAAV